MEQAIDFHRSAVAGGVLAAKPLLLYYCFMNVVKAFILTSGLRPHLDVAQHGLSEQLGPGGRQLIDAFLRAFPTNLGGRQPALNLFDDFLNVLRGAELAAQTSYPLLELLPQTVFGHRLWATAEGVNDRFIGVEDVRFFSSVTDRSLWLTMYIFAPTLTWLGVTHQQLLQEAGLANDWRVVDCNEEKDGQRLVCLEQRNAINYTHRAADKIMELVDGVRQHLWATVLTTRPFRRYYVYLCPVAQRQFVLPQLASIYAIAYYLGSITRYRPHHFENILNSNYEAFIDGFVNDQSGQFLYLMASEFAQQDVVTSATV